MEASDERRPKVDFVAGISAECEDKSDVRRGIETIDTSDGRRGITAEGFSSPTTWP